MSYTIHLGLAVLLAASVACSSNSNPMSPTATPGMGTVSAVPEGTPTLKANTPGSPAPAPGATTELGPQSTHPGDPVGGQCRGHARQHRCARTPLPAV